MRLGKQAAAVGIALGLGLGLGLAAAAGAQPQPREATYYGHALPADTAEREVRLAPSTRFVNVTHWESVRFVKDGRAFDWKFDSVTTESFPLARIAPAGWDVGQVQVYMLHNPYAYPNGR